MERPKIGYCQRIDLAPSVLLVNAAKLHDLIEWSVWAEQELSKLHQPTVSICSCGSNEYYVEQYKDVTKYYCKSCHEKISKH